MGGIRIGKVGKVRDIINVEGNVYLDGEGPRGLETIVREVLQSDDPASVVELLKRLDAAAMESDAALTRERITAEAERQLETAHPPRPVAEAVRTVAQGAAGGVVSQGIFLALRGVFGF